MRAKKKTNKEHQIGKSKVYSFLWLEYNCQHDHFTYIVMLLDILTS